MRHHFGLGVGHIYGHHSTLTVPEDVNGAEEHLGELDPESLDGEEGAPGVSEGTAETSGEDSDESHDRESEPDLDFTDDEELLAMDEMYG